MRLEVESPENDSNDITNSKKAKFVLITWVGKHVDKELKQRVHGDRHCVKAVIQVCIFMVMANSSKHFGEKAKLNVRSKYIISINVQYV